MKRKLYSALRMLISISLIAFLFYLRRDSLGKTISVIKSLEPSFFIYSSFLFILSIAIISTRLKVLLSVQGFALKFSEASYLTFLGYFFNNFLPTSIGGDVVKAYYVSKKTNDTLSSFVTVFMDRYLGVLSLFLLATASLIFSHSYIKQKPLIWMTVSLLLLLLLFLIFILNRNLVAIFRPLFGFLRRFNIKEKLERIYGAIDVFKNNKAALAQAILISVTAQIICFSAMYLLAKGMRLDMSLKIILLFMPLVSVVSMLPSINGLGIREGAIYFLFSPYVGQENAFALSLLWLFMLFLISLIGAITYIIFTQDLAAKEIRKPGGSR